MKLHSILCVTCMDCRHSTRLPPKGGDASPAAGDGKIDAEAADSHTPTRMPYTYEKNAAGLYVCQHCGVTKERQNTMHYHLKKHEGHLPFQCTHCNKEFLQASTLALHIAARHPQAATAAAPTDAPTPSFGCPCCDHTTLTKANAVLHYLRTHCAEEVKAFQATSKDPTNSLTCAACEKVCKSATAYLYHVASANCIARALPLEKQDALKGILGQTSPLSSHEIREREEEVLTRAKAILSKEGVNVAEKRRQNPIAKRVHLLSITSTISHRSNILDELEVLMAAPTHQP